jgi:AcrR family transcriptional regulator
MAAETSQTLDRGLRVLEVLADAPDGLSVTELAAALGVSRTVVYRLVVTLEQHALLRRGSDGRARLGMGVLSLARQVQPVLRDAAMPALRRLADSTAATAYLSVVDGLDVLTIAVVEPTRSDLHVAHRVGARIPLERSAGGRAILAARGAGGRATDPGWVTAVGDAQPGAIGLAAPVLGVAGIEASVGIFLIGDAPLEDAGNKVVRVATEIGRALR